VKGEECQKTFEALRIKISEEFFFVGLSFGSTGVKRPIFPGKGTAGEIFFQNQGIFLTKKNFLYIFFNQGENFSTKRGARKP